MTRERDHDFDFEPMPGLPAPLPDGEALVWRGAPDPWRLAIRACRLPLVGGYFAALAVWQGASGIARGAAWWELGNTLSFTLILAALSLALLALLGWVIARNAIYTVTSRRIIIRHGIAMPMAINIPFAKIDGAESRIWPDGTADLSFKLAPGSRVPHLLLWPFARPLRYWPTEPMLRAVPDGARVASLVAQSLAAANAADITAASLPEAVDAAPPARRPRAARDDGRFSDATSAPLATATGVAS